MSENSNRKIKIRSDIDSESTITIDGDVVKRAKSSGDVQSKKEKVAKSGSFEIITDRGSRSPSPEVRDANTSAISTNSSPRRSEKKPERGSRSPPVGVRVKSDKSPYLKEQILINNNKELENKIKELEAKILDFESQMDTRVDSKITDILSKMDTKIVALENRIVELESKFNGSK